MKQKKKANARFYSELRQTDSWVVVELTDIRAVADDGDEELFGKLFLKWQGGLRKDRTNGPRPGTILSIIFPPNEKKSPRDRAIPS